MKKILFVSYVLFITLFVSQIYAEVVHHNQKSQKARKVFYDLTVTQNGNNIIIPAGKFYINGQSYDVEALNIAFPDGARLFTEKGGGYYLDTTGYGQPVSWGKHIGAPKVIWRSGNTIHVLHSIEE